MLELTTTHTAVHSCTQVNRPELANCSLTCTPTMRVVHTHTSSHVVSVAQVGWHHRLWCSSSILHQAAPVVTPGLGLRG